LTVNKHLKEITKDFPLKFTSNIKDSLNLDLAVKETMKNHYEKAFSVHSPDELPMLMEEENAIEFSGGKLIEALITAEVTMIDDDLASLDIADRLCYMDGERKLKFFKAYTKQNCEIECFSNISVEVCGCVSFDVVRNQTTKVCGLEESKCVKALVNELKFTEQSDRKESCECLQTCNLINYAVDFIQTRLSDP
jgi:acid-sensing ion channel, other